MLPKRSLYLACDRKQQLYNSRLAAFAPGDVWPGNGRPGLSYKHAVCAAKQITGASADGACKGMAVSGTSSACPCRSAADMEQPSRSPRLERWAATCPTHML